MMSPFTTTGPTPFFVGSGYASFMIQGSEGYFSLVGQGGAIGEPPSIAQGSVTPMPRGGILRNLRICVQTDQPADGDLLFTININGVDSPLSITVAAGAPAGLYGDTVNIAETLAGDLVSLHIVNSSPANSSAQFSNFTVEYV